MFSLTILTLLSFLISQAVLASQTSDPDADLSALTDVFLLANQYVAPDGFNRSAALINGTDPGPLIQVKKNDILAIRVIDNLTDTDMPLETSIHWHGFFQHTTNWADGAAGVTQCPIQSGDTFLYKFNVSDQIGTHWYHSHYAAQYCDGVRGALVVYDPDDPLAYLYDVDDETTVITLADWYHIPSGKLENVTGPIFPNSTLINGRGRYPQGPSVPLSVINVQPWLRYRLRVVSISCSPSFNFTIDGHRMTIIEADGIEVEPVEVDSLRIFAGQRYSVVITADRPIGNYWIRALSSAPNSSYDGGQNMAILRYSGAPDQDPTSPPGPYELPFNEADLHPLIDPAAPGIPEIGKADIHINLETGQNSAGRFTINDVSWVDPPVPVLLQILSGTTDPSQLLPPGSFYGLELGKVVEISFPNPTKAPGAPHPIHLHGHAFSVVRLAGTNNTNFVNPVRRDVVSMGSNPDDNVTIRFVTDNPGPWFLHCHIDWHLHHGFAAVMAEATNETSEVVFPPDEWYKLCHTP